MEDLSALQHYLNRIGHLGPDEEIKYTEKPGEGNMNYVVRVGTNQRHFILKQSRPWVEKYPQIAAPVERSQVEATFLEKIQGVDELENSCPKLLWSDPQNYILAIEDLGRSSDFTHIYAKHEKISSDDLESATIFLRRLHKLPLSTFPENREMRKLNHEHIFRFPFLRENGLDLDATQKGLASVAAPFKVNEKLKSEISKYGEIYLAPGRALIHGDFYPGSWLNTNEGIKIIDPEFAFHGPPEFDVAVMIAHMMLAKQGKRPVKKIWKLYQPPANFDTALFSAFAGIEIMRRLIGIAQLPLELSIADKINLMAKATEWIEKKNLAGEL
ncbi:MAG: phosphotransferase [Saprospiraceae bacterium]|nr:phosphotransferase [Saprospiraceae bacterium]